MNETAEKMLSPDEIREYLLNNSDFFLENQDLFTQINFPHETSGAVSLIERQVQVLRESEKESKNLVAELTETATSNHELLKKMQQLTLQLLSAENGTSLLNNLESLMKDQFELDSVQLLLAEGSASADLPLCQFSSAEHLQQMRADIFNLDIYVGRIPAKLSEYFDADSLYKLGSIALLKLDLSDQPGYLLLGSSEESRFQSDMATDFIDFIAKVFSNLFKQSLGQS
ncbi:MAG: DUF484 family protein [Porticoccaceae bacterium]|jgi:uncharacterized protein|nr:DUF484 family protein [Porticoccaceae bacterium]